MGLNGVLLARINCREFLDETAKRYISPTCQIGRRAYGKRGLPRTSEYLKSIGSLSPYRMRQFGARDLARWSISRSAVRSLRGGCKRPMGEPDIVSIIMDKYPGGGARWGRRFAMNTFPFIWIDSNYLAIA